MNTNKKLNQTQIQQWASILYGCTIFLWVPNKDVNFFFIKLQITVK